MHGSTIEDDCLIAMGAILLNGVHVGTGSIVGAGAVVSRRHAHPAELARARRPGKVVRQTTDEERDRIRHTVESYVELQQRYRPA